MQLLEVATGHSQFLSHFSIPQAMPTQPVTHSLATAVPLEAARQERRQCPGCVLEEERLVTRNLEASKATRPVPRTPPKGGWGERTAADPRPRTPGREKCGERPLTKEPLGGEGSNILKQLLHLIIDCRGGT